MRFAVLSPRPGAEPPSAAVPPKRAGAEPEKHNPLAALRIGLCYWWRHGRWPDLVHPMRFTEWVQWRKLHDRDPRYPVLADKVAAKAFVAETLGAEWVTPTLWRGCALPAEPVWPRPFVVKSRHGCNQTAFVHDARADWAGLRRRARGWLRRGYGWWLDEWAYRRIERGLLIEPFLGDARTSPLDYKLFVFGGRVEAVQVHLDREGRHRWIVFDRLWRRVSGASADADPPRPASLSAMIAAAEVLGAAFDFVRVDFYEVAGRPVFGEMTFYPGSGLYRLDPDGLDAVWGECWRRAREGLATPMSAAPRVRSA